MSVGGCSAPTNWSSSAGSEEPVRHSKRFWTDYEESNTDSAAGSEGLGFGSLTDSSECNFGEYVERHFLNCVPGTGFDSVEVFDIVYFHCARQSDCDSLCHYVED